MPFIRNPAPLIGHEQPDDDPVRAAAEAVDPLLQQRLFDAWEGLHYELAGYAPDGMPGVAVLDRIANALRQEVQPAAHELLLAHSLGRAAMQRLLLRSEVRKDFTLGFHFDRVAPAVQDQADQYAARFVREIGEDTRSTLAAVIQEGIAEGLGPPAVARRMRESVGLTRAQASAVQNYRRLLETGSTEALTRALRDRRFDVEPEALAQLTPEQIDARVDAYRRRYVSYRANTIARYETLYASNAGSVSAVNSAIKAGTLPKTTVKTWMIAKDELTCLKCRSIPQLQPAGLPLDQPFLWRAGARSGEIQFAPLHPSCRCTNGFRANG